MAQRICGECSIWISNRGHTDRNSFSAKRVGLSQRLDDTLDTHVHVNTQISTMPRVPISQRFLVASAYYFLFEEID